MPPVGGVLGSQHFLPGGDLAVVCSVSSLLQFPDSTEAGSANRHSDPAAAAAQPSLTKVRGGPSAGWARGRRVTRSSGDQGRAPRLCLSKRVVLF